MNTLPLARKSLCQYFSAHTNIQTRTLEIAVPLSNKKGALYDTNCYMR